jgi:DNA-directed RNA polymerase specialized sigma24 family protein
MPRQSPFVITLTEEDRRRLEQAARCYTSPYRDVIRAKIVLYAARGLSNDEIARRLDTPRQVVSKWRKRFFEQGVVGLDELPRQGRPRVFSPRYRRRRQGPRL